MADIPETPAPAEAPPTAEQVFRDYAPRIYNIARRLLNNDADAEDVTSEVLLQVVRKLHTFRGDSALPTWLHRVTVNAALALREKRALRQKRETASDVDQLAQNEIAPSHDPWKFPKLWNVPPEVNALAAEQRILIEKAIGELPEPFRDVYVLADVEGLPNAEIAEMLNLSLPAVKSRLHRARMRMRDLLAPHFEESLG